MFLPQQFCIFLASLSIIATPAIAENIIRTSAPIVLVNTWQDAEPLYGEWTISGEPYQCDTWLPATDDKLLGQAFNQNATCVQDETRTVQSRQKTSTGVYRNVGEPLLETRSISESVSKLAVGTGVQNSCLKAKQFNSSATSGVYQLDVNGKKISAYCDMTTDGGGWTLIGKGTQNMTTGWSSSRNEFNYPASPLPSLESTFKLSDADINAIPKKSYKVITTGYNNTRFFRGSRDYNHMAEPFGDCAISYASEAWDNPRGNGNQGSVGLPGAGGLIDKNGNNYNDGYYVLTSLVNRWDGWAAGNGTIGSAVGSGGAGTRISLWMWVR